MAETHLIDVTGRTVFRGTQKPPGGGSQPTHGQYGGNPTVVNDQAFDALPWNTASGPEAFLDLSTPTAPTWAAAGTYTLTVPVSTTAPLTAGGFVFAVLNGVVGQTSEHPDFGLSVTQTVIASAGDALALQVFNGDGAAPRTFQIGTVDIVKLA